MCALDYNYGKVMEACQHGRFGIRTYLITLPLFPSGSAELVAGHQGRGDE